MFRKNEICKHLLHDKCYETLKPFRIDMLAHAYWLVPGPSGHWTQSGLYRKTLTLNKTIHNRPIDGPTCRDICHPTWQSDFSTHAN